MYSYGPSHMAGRKQDDQHERTFISSVRIRDVALKTCQRRWTIGKSGERGSMISVLVARQDGDDIYIYIYIYVCVCVCVSKWVGPWRNFYCFRIYLFFSFLNVSFQLIKFKPSPHGYGEQAGCYWALWWHAWRGWHTSWCLWKTQ